MQNIFYIVQQNEQVTFKHMQYYTVRVAIQNSLNWTYWFTCFHKHAILKYIYYKDGDLIEVNLMKLHKTLSEILTTFDSDILLISTCKQIFRISNKNQIETEVDLIGTSIQKISSKK